MEIFIQVEFGVTYSKSHYPLESSVECSFIKKVKTVASKLKQNEDDGSKSTELPPTFSTPRIRPLDLSGPFDKDQQELWIMQTLARYNLPPAALQSQIRPGKDGISHIVETNDERGSFDLEVKTLNRKNDLELYHHATIAIGTFFYDSDSDVDCEKPWKFPCSESDNSFEDFNLLLNHVKTPKEAKRYGMYRNLATLW